MLESEPRTPGLYYWCPIFGNGDLVNPIDTVQEPTLMRVRPDGMAEHAEKSGNPAMDAPFHICNTIWSRFAGCPQNARVYGYRVLNERSKQAHDARLASNH